MNGTVYVNGFQALFFAPLSFNSLNVLYLSKLRFPNDPNSVYVQLWVLVFVHRAGQNLRDPSCQEEKVKRTVRVTERSHVVTSPSS